jgi:hypothetical protein
MVCDEGSQLVKLLGQIKNTEKEDHVQNDEIIESLLDEETNEESQDLDFSLSNVDNQIQDMEQEIVTFEFSNRIKLSKSKDYSNALNSLIDSAGINNMSDENIYNLQLSDGKRKIKKLDNLEIKIGSIK